MKSPTIIGFDQHASTRAAAVLWPAQRAVVRKNDGPSPSPADQNPNAEGQVCKLISTPSELY
jgi:hypothetical protein